MSKSHQIFLLLFLKGTLLIVYLFRSYVIVPKPHQTFILIFHDRKALLMRKVNRGFTVGGGGKPPPKGNKDHQEEGDT